MRKIYDHESPTAPHDLPDVVAERGGGSLPMQSYGEYLWRADVPETGDYRACTTDAAGNKTCSDPIAATPAGL